MPYRCCTWLVPFCLTLTVIASGVIASGCTGQSGGTPGEMGGAGGSNHDARAKDTNTPMDKPVDKPVDTPVATHDAPLDRTIIVPDAMDTRVAEGGRTPDTSAKDVALAMDTPIDLGSDTWDAGVTGETSGAGETGGSGDPTEIPAGLSCTGLPATCGPSGKDNCCTRLLIPGGMFNRRNLPAYPATVDDFYLDKHEITVGRFRAFVTAGMGTRLIPPTAGAGVHPSMAGSGWNPAWNTNLYESTESLLEELKCNSTEQTWTDLPGANESRPQNCLSWYTAFAFCAWDGGRLPTETEWNFAAAGGSQQLDYPWGNTTLDYSKASYDCMGDGVIGCKLTDLLVVGSKPAGNGTWGHADLAGNVFEWVLDGYADQSTSCNNCANLTAISNRVIRGGSYFGYGASYLRTTARIYSAPTSQSNHLGARCAKSAQ